MSLETIQNQRGEQNWQAVASLTICLSQRYAPVTFPDRRLAGPQVPDGLLRVRWPALRFDLHPGYGLVPVPAPGPRHHPERPGPD